MEARRINGARQSEDQLPTPRDQRGLVRVGTPGTVVVDGAGAGFRGSVRNGYSGIEAGVVEHVGEQQRRGASANLNDRGGFGAFYETRQRRGADLESVSSHAAHGMEAHRHAASTDRRRVIFRLPYERHRQFNPFVIERRGRISEVVYNFPRAGRRQLDFSHVVFDLPDAARPPLVHQIEAE